MPKYRAGDKVRVNGILMDIGSWPDDDEGPFFATYKTPQGVEVQGTYWAGRVELDGEPLHSSDTVELVAPGGGVVSTAGEIDEEPAQEPDPAAEPEAAK